MDSAKSSGTYRAQQSTLIEADRPSSLAPSTEKNRILLTVLTGPARGQVLKVDRQELHLGRSEEAEFIIPDPNLSRLHARLVCDRDNHCIIEDCGSTNGTYVGGQRITRPTPLTDGVRIGLGARTLIRFAVQDALEESALLGVHRSALHDQLTGAYNRHVFDDRLESELAFSVRHSRPLSLLLLDIDHFKSINDTYGHQAGDWVLQKLGEEIQGTLRTEDVFARYGGEEFAVLLRDAYPTHAAITAERLRAIVEATEFAYAGQCLRVTISIGVACNLSQGSDGNELVNQADRALYQAKAEGRNRIQMHGVVARHLRPA